MPNNLPLEIHCLPVDPVHVFQIDRRRTVLGNLQQNRYLRDCEFVTSDLREKFQEHRQEILTLLSQTPMYELFINHSNEFYPEWNIEGNIAFKLNVHGIGQVRLDRALGYIRRNYIKLCPVTHQWWKIQRMIPVPLNTGTTLDGEYVSPEAFRYPENTTPNRRENTHYGLWRCAECGSFHVHPRNILISDSGYEVYCTRCQRADSADIEDWLHGYRYINDPYHPEPDFDEDYDLDEEQSNEGQYGYGFNPTNLFPGFLRSKKEGGGDRPVQRTMRKSAVFKNKAFVPDKTRYYGVEYECVFEDSPAPFSQINRILDRFAISTYDSSVGDGDHGGNGVEIITVPATLKVHREKWQPFFKEFSSNFEFMDEVGCHIHVSQDAISRFNARKIFYFLNRDVNEVFIRSISRRNQDEIDRWCRFKYRDLSKNAITDDKYSVINESTHHPTYELRIFAWPLTYDVLMAQLEFFDTLIDFCDQASFKTLDFIEYIKWFGKKKGSKKQYRFLWTYLIKKQWMKEDGTNTRQSLDENAVRKESERKEADKKEKERRVRNSRLMQEVDRIGRTLPRDQWSQLMEFWSYETMTNPSAGTEFEPPFVRYQRPDQAIVVVPITELDPSANIYVETSTPIRLIDRPVVRTQDFRPVEIRPAEIFNWT